MGGFHVFAGALLCVPVEDGPRPPACSGAVASTGAPDTPADVAEAPRFLGSYPPYGSHFFAGALLSMAVEDDAPTPACSGAHTGAAVPDAPAGAAEARRFLGSYPPYCSHFLVGMLLTGPDEVLAVAGQVSRACTAALTDAAGGADALRFFGS